MSKVQYVPAVGESDPFLDFLDDFATHGEAYRGVSFERAAGSPKQTFDDFVAMQKHESELFDFLMGERDKAGHRGVA